MAIQVASFLIPKNGNLWYVLEDKYIKGGLHIVATDADRDNILDVNRKQGMLVIVQASGKVWLLLEDMISWQEFKVGGGGAVRQTVLKTIIGIAAQERADFELSLGGTAIIHKLAVDSPCQVEIFETSARNDTNPFRFVATPDHLVDSGMTKMTDGTILRGRRYHIVSNQESEPSSLAYFRITNLDAKPAFGDVPTKDIQLTISFLSIEGGLDPDPSLNT